MERDLNKIISKRIRDEIEFSGIPKSDIAKAIGVSKPTISQYISGKIHPSLATLSKLCTYLGVSADEILDTKIEK